MATFTADRAQASVPVFKPQSGQLGVTWGHYTPAAELAPGDIVKLCKLPAGALIVGGWLRGVDHDTDGSETFDADVGFDDDPDALGNFGIHVGDAVAGFTPEGGLEVPFGNLLRAGVVLQRAASDATDGVDVIQLTCVDDAAGGGTTKIGVVCYFTMP